TRCPYGREADDWGVKTPEGYEVKSPDEGRLEHYKWRRERDEIRRLGDPPPKAPEGEKAEKNKAPFKDRVLEKALDFLRGEIKRANAPAAPNNRGVERRPAPALDPPPAVAPLPAPPAFPHPPDVSG